MTTATKAKTRKYKVLVGNHCIGHKIYRQGDVFESDVDLCKKFNHPGGRKFDYAEEDEQPSVQQVARQGFENGNTAKLPAPNFDKMNVEQLKAYAAEEEVELGTAVTKAEIITAITGRK